MAASLDDLNSEIEDIASDLQNISGCKSVVDMVEMKIWKAHRV